MSLLPADFSWKKLFEGTSIRPSTDSDDEQRSFDEVHFTTCLSVWTAAATRHESMLSVKREKETLAQNLYEKSLWVLESSHVRLEGRCVCETKVQASIASLVAKVDSVKLEQLRGLIDVLHNHNSGDVFFSLYEELLAELDTARALAPLLLSSSIPAPPRRSAPQSPRGTSSSSGAAAVAASPLKRETRSLTQHIRLVLLAVSSLVDLISKPTVSASCKTACKRMVLEVAHHAYEGILNSDEHPNQSEHVRDIVQSDGSWKDLDKMLRSPATLESEAIGMAHKFFLRSLLEQGSDCDWARPLVRPTLQEIRSDWLSSVLLSKDIYSEKALVAAVSRFPLSDIAKLSTDEALSKVLLPIQKAFERYAAHEYFTLASAMGHILGATTTCFPALFTKCVAILTKCPRQLVAVGFMSLLKLPWDTVPKENADDLIGALLEISPAYKPAEYISVSQAERLSFRTMAITSWLNVQANVIRLNASPAEQFPVLSCLARLVSHAPVLIAQELMFHALVRTPIVAKAPNAIILKEEALRLLESIVPSVPTPKLGSSLIELCACHFPDIGAEDIAAVLEQPAFSHWVPSLSDIRHMANLACHRRLDIVSSPGVERLDALVEQLLLDLPNIQYPPNIRPLATRNGGQLLMGTRWFRSSYLNQLCAAFMLFSSRYIGMPSSWVLDTLFSENMSLFLENDEVSSFSDTDLAAAERLLHLKCPHESIELEWRVLKILVSLHLARLNAVEFQSATSSPVFTKYTIPWLESLELPSKVLAILPQLSHFASSRLLARVVQVASGGSHCKQLLTPLLKVFLPISGLTPQADKFVFGWSIFDALAHGDENENALHKVVSLWYECLWPLVLEKSKEASVVLDKIIHAVVASGKAEWMVHEHATPDQAYTFCKMGQPFLAISVAASVKPFLPQSSNWNVQVSGLTCLTDLFQNHMAEKSLGLVCWDRIAALLNGASFPSEAALTFSDVCLAVEKTLPLGSPVRKVYSSISESLRHHGCMPYTSILSDASVRRYICSRYPPALKLQPGKAAPPNANAPLSPASPRAPTKKSSSTNTGVVIDFSSDPIQVDSFCASSFGTCKYYILNENTIELCTRAGRNFISDVTTCMGLEQQFLQRASILFQHVTSKAVVVCSQKCLGGAELVYETMTQTPEALQEASSNRQAFNRTMSRAWSEAAELAFATFVVANGFCSDLEVCRKVLLQSIRLIAEKLVPKPSSFGRIMSHCLGVLGSNDVNLGLAVIDAFFDGCKKRVLSDEAGGHGLEMEDTSGSSTRVGLLFRLFDPMLWSTSAPLGFLRALRQVFLKSSTLSSGEFRRILGAFSLEKTLSSAVKAGPECMSLVLQLSAHLLANAECSVVLMRELMELKFPESVADACVLAVDITECWSSGIGGSVKLQAVSLVLGPDDLPQAPPAWSASWFQLLESRPLRDPEVSLQILRQLSKALNVRRKPNGLVPTVRRILQLLPAAAYTEMEQVLQVCGQVTTPSVLLETASLLAKMAPNSGALFRSWVTWFCGQACMHPQSLDNVLNTFVPLWSHQPWWSMDVQDMALFLKEIIRSGASQRSAAMFRALTYFRNLDDAHDLPASSVLYVSLLVCARALNGTESPGLIKLLASLDWTSVKDEHIVPEVGTEIFSKLVPPLTLAQWEASGILLVLEAIRDGCLKSDSPLLSMYWIEAIAKALPVVPSVLPLVVRVMMRLCRKVGSDGRVGILACKTVIAVCTSLKVSESEKLKGVLVTFVSSLPDPQLCLRMLKAIPQSVSNPLFAAPLTEALLHCFLAVSPPDSNPLELAAQNWTPPSLPEDAKADFPIHDVAAANQLSTALTMLLILERQRQVSPGPEQNPQLWCEFFAAPCLASVSGFAADPQRPFDMVGLWIFALRTIVMPFRPVKHPELSRVVVDFISLLDDTWQGYNYGLPQFMSDRMKLVAGAVGAFGIRLTVEGVGGNLEGMHAAGVQDRISQLVPQANALGCKGFSAVLLKLCTVPFAEFAKSIFTDVLPMASYLQWTVPRTPPPPPETPPPPKPDQPAA